MTDAPLNPDALEAAAKAIDPGLYSDFEADLVKNAGFSEEKAREYVIAKKRRTEDYARAVVSAYLAHAQPVVSTLEELDKLPIGSVILDADNDAGIVEYDGVIFCETHKLSKAYVFKHYRNLRVIYTPEGGTE